MLFRSANAGGQGLALEVLFLIAPAPTAPVVTSNPTAAALVGQPFLYAIVATNSPTGYAAAGLPAGLTLDAATGVISGLPNQPTVQPHLVTLTASNASGQSAPRVLAITVAPAPSTPTITSALTASARVGVPFTYQVTASLTPTSFVAIALPPGLDLDPLAGVIAGTLPQAGSFAITLRAGNAAGLGQSATLLLTAAPPLAAPDRKSVV